VLALLKTETDRSVLLRLCDFMSRLLYAHGAELIDRIEADVRGNSGLRWLLGGAYWSAQGQALQGRLKAIADVAGHRADQDAHNARGELIDFDALSIEELAPVWIEQTDKPFKDHDHNWQAFDDFVRNLVDEDPDKALDLVLAVLRIETHPALLSVLAAGLLEDVIDMRVIDRIERAAAADPRFLALLQGVWYSSKPDDVRARLDAILRRGAAT
jgi:hypothetical protein